MLFQSKDLFISFFLFSLVSLLICIELSCENREKVKQEKIIKNLIGEKINLPDSIVFLKNYELDTIKIQQFESNIKIISFIDGRCGVCIKKLKGLIELKKKFNKNFPKSVDYVFFVYTQNYDFFKEKYYPLLDIEQPIIISNLSFLDKHPLPGLGVYKTVLTINDTIKVVGNPIGNKDLEELYENVINDATSIE